MLLARDSTSGLASLEAPAEHSCRSVKKHMRMPWRRLRVLRVHVKAWPPGGLCHSGMSVALHVQLLLQHAGATSTVCSLAGLAVITEVHLHHAQHDQIEVVVMN